MNHPEFPYGTHSDFRYFAKDDQVHTRCEVTGFWQIVQDPEGASYCAGCEEHIRSIPKEAQRPQTKLPPSVPLREVLEAERDGGAADYTDTQEPRLPCGCLSHENGGPADYGPECR